MKEIRVDPVGNDLPVGVEIPLERHDRGLRHGDGGAQLVEALLEGLPERAIADGIVEVRMERADDGDLGLRDRQQRQHGRERRMHVHDLIAAIAQHLTHVAPERGAYRDAALRSIDVPRHAAAESNHVRHRVGPVDVRGDDVDFVAEPARLLREEMHVLAHAAEMRIVVLRDEGDAQRRQAAREIRIAQVRPALQPIVRLARDTGNTRRSSFQSCDRNGPTEVRRHARRRSRLSGSRARASRT